MGMGGPCTLRMPGFSGGWVGRREWDGFRGRVLEWWWILSVLNTACNTIYCGISLPAMFGMGMGS